jgi:cation diffusion facilitator family transporter
MEQALHLEKIGVARLSVISNTTLVLLKLVAGLAIGSVAVISEALHSAADLAASIIAYFSVRISGQPADDGHPFGHEKFENISGTIEALLIFLAAGWIIFEAVRKLLHPEQIDHPALGAGVMMVSSVVNIIISQMLFKVGNKTHSVALIADAWHLRTDVWTSAGVMAGLGVIWLVGLVWPRVNIHWVDPVAALAVALLIIKAAWELTMQSARDLLDASLPAEEQHWIQDCVHGFGTPVRGLHGLRTRKAGHRRFVEFHLEIDPAVSVGESHAITERIEDAIHAQFPHTDVTVHVEPAEG